MRSGMSTGRRLLSAACLVLLLAASLPSLAAAEVKLKVNKDSRRVVDLGTFGFTDRGAVTLHVNGFSIGGSYLDDEGVVSPADDPIGFVIDKVSSTSAARVEKNYANKDGANERLCFVDDPLLTPSDEGARVVFPLNGRKISEIRNGLPVTMPILVSGLYGIFFYNCRGYKDTPVGVKLPKSEVSFDVKFELSNMDPNTGAKRYLSYGTGPLPYWNLFFATIFAAFALLWAREVRNNAPHVRLIHQIMLFLVVVKALSLLLEAGRQLHFDVTGKTNYLDYFFYIIVSVKGMTLFGILLLLGTGFSVLKGFLSDNDRKLLLFVLPAQLVINILIATIEMTSEGARAWQFYRDLLQLLDLACCLAVLLPLIWSMKNLREVSESSGKATAAIHQMAIFRNFYIVVLAYIYLTRVVMVVVEGMLPYDVVYIADVLLEVVAVLFYAYTGHRFRPFAQGVYSAVPVNEPEDVELGSRREMGAV